MLWHSVTMGDSHPVCENINTYRCIRFNLVTRKKGIALYFVIGDEAVEAEPSRKYDKLKITL